jgi:CHASE2 domain-containing sensor protein
VSKRVILNIGEGSFERGFPVMIQIGDEGLPPQVAETGRLPALPRLPQDYQCWQTHYEALGQRSRIKVRQITPRSRQEDCHQAAQILQEQFNIWLKAKEFRPIQDIWRETLSPNDEIRVLLQTHEAELQRLPWHLWDVFVRYPKAEIGMSSPAFKQPRSVMPQPKVAILAILGDSAGIDTSADRTLLEQIPDADVTFLVEPTRRELNEQLYRQPWHILFFAGHSESKKGCGRIYLNATESLTFSELANTLRQAGESGLQLAILNSCDGFEVARDLADLQIPQTVFMREPVPDPVAQAFLKYFLTAFSQGQSLYLALRTARDRLEALENEFFYATWLPVIYQHPGAIPPTWQDLIDHRSQKRRRSLMRVALASAIATLAVVGVRHTGLLQSLELKAYDQMLQTRSLIQPEPPDSRIVVIEITDQDFEAQKSRGEDLKDTSLSNPSLLRLLDILKKNKPKVIGLDLFRNPTTMPPQVVQRFQQMHNLIGICDTKDATHDLSGFPAPSGLPLERIGFADAPVDPDGVGRRQMVFMDADPASSCPVNWSLSSQLALYYLEKQGIKPEFTSDHHLKLKDTVFRALSQQPGAYQQAVDLAGSQILLNYRAEQVYSISLTDVLDERVGIETALRDRIVLVGVTRRQSRDVWTTPFIVAGQPLTQAGVFLQAQGVSQILSAVLDGRSLLQPVAVWLEIVILVLFSLVGSGLMEWARSSFYQIISLGLAVVVAYAIALIGFTQGVWLPFLPALLGLLLASAIIAAYRVHVVQINKQVNLK